MINTLLIAENQAKDVFSPIVPGFLHDFLFDFRLFLLELKTWKQEMDGS